MNHTKSCPPRLLLILSCILIQFQCSRHTVLSRQWFTVSPSELWYNFSTVNDIKYSTQPKPNQEDISTSSKFAACLMVKDDNDLLYEWLAYHYTTMPLRYVVIGSDINNTQDPELVLRRWTDAGIDHLQYWVLQPEQFIHRHGNHHDKYGFVPENLSPEQERELHHHALVHRQKGFITTCAEILQSHGVGWTLFIDSDEFLALNQLSDDDTQYQIGGEGHYSMKNISYALRRDVLGTSRASHVSEVIQTLERQGADIGSCYTLPRLLVGALENTACPKEYGVESIQRRAREYLGDRYQHLSTLRFHRHAKKGDFSYSKFGKVMMDLSRIPAVTIRNEVPRNIHRPFAEFCHHAASAHFPDSVFFLMHYIGSWERYNSRPDNRRSFNEWQRRAFVDVDDSACSATVFSWFLRFTDRVGGTRAKYLLGGMTDKHTKRVSKSNHLCSILIVGD